ncbi:MAG: FKBP-type peptidyl-prolyl cis-trans isomerase N-terminal domain-containing protein [Verrucomicrobiota bacterium]|nr:FKBP-type peptidyl-prolyl cis-trans isomerase N-terminal domain-containing protein [Verrucomicrobiota bacterium]
MKITIIAAFLGAGLLFTGALSAQDSPTLPGKKAEGAKETPKNQPKPAPAGPTNPAKLAEPKITMDSKEIRTMSSYGFGYRNGRTFTNQTGRFGLQMEDIDREQFLKGLFDALELKDSKIDQEKINEALNQLSLVIKEREKKIAVENKVAGEKFLAENKNREGIITSKSGLQYEILKKGEGEIYPAPAPGERPTKQFMTIYRGTLIDGTEFDSSKGKLAPMSLNVIAGFREALTQMPVGSKWKLFIPAELAYKENRRSATLGPNSMLIFELELAELKDLPKPPSRPLARPTPSGRSVSPPVRVPGRPGAKAVSPPVRVPVNPGTGKAPAPSPGKPRARAVSPPVRIPTAPAKQPDPPKIPVPVKPGKALPKSK